MDPLKRDNGVYQPRGTSAPRRIPESTTYPPFQPPVQQQQAQLNKQGDDGRVGGIPDAASSAMWKQFEQNVKGGSAMTPQQFAAQFGTGGLGRAPVSFFIPHMNP